MPQDALQPPGRTRSLAVWGCGALVVLLTLLALGTWQVHRLAWKRDLQARIDARIHAAPVPLPSGVAWGADGAWADGQDEYRRVTASGTWRHDMETLVQANTVAGPGFWVLTPLVRADGAAVLVNRGFVPPERRARSAHGATPDRAPAQVVGLLRRSEPGGGFLRHNDPAGGRWYSRDVRAIAQARGLATSTLAPFFIDAEADPGQGPALPLGGLTVVQFPNHHLMYAVTWYGLALMLVLGVGHVAREERAARRAKALHVAPPMRHG